MPLNEDRSITDMLQKELAPYLEDSEVCSMANYIQHGTTTTLQHCLCVMQTSCTFAARFHLRVNYSNLAIGALLHDFYLYDWHTYRVKGTLHGFAHPHIACKNARLRFHVNPEIQHIIRTHMWPLTLRYIPRSREAKIVCLVDKYCSALETLVGFGCVLRLFFYRYIIRKILHKTG